MSLQLALKQYYIDLYTRKIASFFVQAVGDFPHEALAGQSTAGTDLLTHGLPAPTPDGVLSALDGKEALIFFNDTVFNSNLFLLSFVKIYSLVKVHKKQALFRIIFFISCNYVML